jgi:hypothetical protein
VTSLHQFVVSLLIAALAGSCAIDPTEVGTEGSVSTPDASTNAAHDAGTSSAGNDGKAPGTPCVAACGGKLDLDCAVPTSDCGGNWCVVDLRTTGKLRTYCTFGCAAQACPAGFHCGRLEVIGGGGEQQGCLADVPTCGNAVREFGELCELGQASDEGTCRSDCTGWTPVCGDKKVQPGEQCEENSKEAVCIACSLAPPEVRFEGLTMKLTAERWSMAGVIHEGTESAVHPLPTEAPANGCGRHEIIENTAELVRLEFTHCDARSNTLATWQVALPRQAKALSYTADPKWVPKAKLKRLSDGATMDYGTLTKLSANVVALSAYEVGTAKYSIEMTNYAPGGGGKAYLTFAVSLLLPPL